MTEAVAEREQLFLSQLARMGPVRRGPEWMQELRREALGIVCEQGLPTTELEAWRYTDLTALANTTFELASEPSGFDLPKDTSFLEKACLRLVFCNGHVNHSLSCLDDLPEGVSVTPLSTALAEGTEMLKESFSTDNSHRQSVFSTLNLALATEGAVIKVDDEVVLEEPIHLIFLNRAASESFMLHPRVIAVTGTNSQVRIVESHLGLDDGLYLSNAVTEITVGENSAVDYYKLQKEGSNAYHIGSVESFQARNGRTNSSIFTLGGKLVRNDSKAVLGGEGGHAELNGLYLASRGQHVDNYTTIDHAQPHCSSRELYKGILSENARGVFRGRIIVAEGAQKTDSKQTNNNLLLSDEALVTTKPQLEIYADDVKCTHGATIGQVEGKAMFYLRARGIDKEMARSMLIYAFASEVVSKIKIPSLREQLDGALSDRLPGALVRK